jgi:hypothetical protein
MSSVDLFETSDRQTFMHVSSRVEKLRKKSLKAEETLSSERAQLLTDFYIHGAGLVSVPVFRALAFQYILEHKSISIPEGELIVGEKGPKQKYAPTFPELCCHSLEDLDVLNDREKISFKVNPETRALYETAIIPFWKGKTMREVIFEEMTDEWKDAYHAGIFTEFMEQRSPGHTVLDDKIYKKGMLDFRAEIEARIAGLDYLNDLHAYEKQEELHAMQDLLKEKMKDEVNRDPFFKTSSLKDLMVHIDRFILAIDLLDKFSEQKYLSLHEHNIRVCRQYMIEIAFSVISQLEKDEFHTHNFNVAWFLLDLEKFISKRKLKEMRELNIQKGGDYLYWENIKA